LRYLPPSLTDLYIYRCRGIVDLSHLVNLERLDIDRCTDLIIERLPARLVEFRAIQIARTSAIDILTEKEMKVIPESVEVLSLYGIPSSESLSRFSNLRELMIFGEWWGPKTPIDFSHVPNLTKLAVYDIVAAIGNTEEAYDKILKTISIKWLDCRGGEPCDACLDRYGYCSHQYEWEERNERAAWMLMGHNIAVDELRHGKSIK
jgi:hypothetical protein